MNIPNQTISLGSVREGPVTRSEIGNSMVLTRTSLSRETNPIFVKPEVSDLDYTQGKGFIPPVFSEAFAPTLIEEVEPETMLEKPSLAEGMLPRALFVAKVIGMFAHQPGLVQAEVYQSQESTKPLSHIEANIKPQHENVLVESAPLKIPLKHEGVHQPEEHEIETERRSIKKIEAGEEEKKRKLKFFKDKSTLAQRIHDIRQAFRMAKVQTEILGLGSKVLGSFIDKFLPDEYPAIISRLIRPNRPDGSYEDTRLELRSHAFSAEDEVVNIALHNQPVKDGWEDEKEEEATDEEVKKVTRNLAVKPFKEIVERRIIRKIVPAPLKACRDIKPEPSLKDFPALSEVFPKAA